MPPTRSSRTLARLRATGSRRSRRATETETATAALPPPRSPPHRRARPRVDLLSPPRKRFRDLGLTLGRYPTGPHNAITDVAGVRVGHTTLIEGDGKMTAGKGPVRTGVTAIIPLDNFFQDCAIAGVFVLNGAGELAGLTQVQEWGLLETPILLTNTMSVGKVSDAAVKWITRHQPKTGEEYDVLIPVVGECDDSYLNDSVGRHIRSEHIYRAIETAAPGPVAEGSVGAGTGMITCDFKAGIGTASRRVPAPDAPGEGGSAYTVGVLVESNFGVMQNLRVDGVAVGELLFPAYRDLARRVRSYGSIIVVVATDAPLMAQQIARLCKRAALGIGRCGSYAAHGSGELVVGFSTANRVPRVTHGMTHRLDVLFDRATGPLYEAVIEATEEAILNALCAADDMRGRDGNFAPGLPLERLAEIMGRYRPDVPRG
ncbi:MAG: S58 family peptidase [Myxococcales bacterium]|nr:S58 family peptidase [Myxococcales bacterium]